jgi:co-chaperonin GroES (HSP10)
MRLVPGPRRLLVEYKEKEEERRVGSIIIPETAEEKEVVEAKIVGTERFSDEDRKIEPGDNAVFMRTGAAEVIIRNTKYFLVHEDNIIAIINLGKKGA